MVLNLALVSLTQKYNWPRCLLFCQNTYSSICVFHLGHLPIHEPNLSKNGSQSDENETYSDQEFDNEFREIPTFQPDYMKIESEFTPTEETVAGFNKVIIISSNQAHCRLI